MIISLYFSLYFSTTQSGEVTLRTTQFLEKLKENPALKIMRDELVSLLQDQLEKIGIPPVCYHVGLTLFNHRTVLE